MGLTKVGNKNQLVVSSKYICVDLNNLIATVNFVWFYEIIGALGARGGGGQCRKHMKALEWVIESVSRTDAYPNISLKQ